MYCRVVRERSLAALGQESVPFIKDPFIKDRDQETDRGRAGTNPPRQAAQAQRASPLARAGWQAGRQAGTCGDAVVNGALPVSKVKCQLKAPEDPALAGVQLGRGLQALLLLAAAVFED